MIKHNYWLHCKEMIHTIYETPMPSASLCLHYHYHPPCPKIYACWILHTYLESSPEDSGKVALSLCEDATYHIPMQLVQCKVKQN